MDSDTDRDKICCIILNYNDAETAAGLAEELKESRLIDDILLVDNCSTDDSWEKFKKLELGWKKEEKEDKAEGKKVSLKQIFPFFILYFIAASIITTVAVQAGVPVEFFNPIKELSKFFIVLAMAAIGLNTNIVDLIRTGGKPIIMGFSCWVGITGVSLLLQRVMGIW